MKREIHRKRKNARNYWLSATWGCGCVRIKNNRVVWAQEIFKKFIGADFNELASIYEIEKEGKKIIIRTRKV